MKYATMIVKFLVDTRCMIGVFIIEIDGNNDMISIRRKYSGIIDHALTRWPHNGLYVSKDIFGYLSFS